MKKALAFIFSLLIGLFGYLSYEALKGIEDAFDDLDFDEEEDDQTF